MVDKTLQKSHNPYGMNEKGHWIWVLVGRVAAYAFFGALFCGIVGVLLIGFSGALTGCIGDWRLYSSYRPIFSPDNMGYVGAMFGGVLGGIGGAVTGAIAFGIYGAIGTPRRSFMPPWLIVRKVFLAMTVATVGVMTSYFLLCAISAFMQKVRFGKAVYNGEMLILFGAPATMICGQIIGSIWAFRSGTKARPQK